MARWEKMPDNACLHDALTRVLSCHKQERRRHQKPADLVLRCGSRLVHARQGVHGSPVVGMFTNLRGGTLSDLLHELEEVERTLDRLERQSFTLRQDDESSEMGCSKEDWDDDVVVRALFDEIDKDKDGSLALHEVEGALKIFQLPEHAENKELSEALINALKNLTDSAERRRIDFSVLRKSVRDLPRARGQRLQWVRALSLDWEVAKLLKHGDIFDGLSGLQRLTKEEAAVHVQDVCSKFTRRLETLLMSGLKALREVKPQTAQDFINSKFSMEGSYKGSFAHREHFDQGPEALIGTPNPNVEEGMRREHCERPNAETRYTAPNYNFEFFPAQEYEFVFRPKKEPGVYPHTPADKKKWKKGVEWKGEHGREAMDLTEVMQQIIAVSLMWHPPLTLVLNIKEVAAMRLYTGPMYMLYNTVLRQFPQYVLEKLSNNKYETTIFCIISGISKLSKASKIPQDRRVFRGLGGMLVPDEFWSEQEGGFRGGVEWGLMSTTTNRSVAMQYSGADKKRGTVFEILVGRVDLGADLSELSQYPGEKEMLFPPLTFLEVVGEPRVEGSVVVFMLRANMNLKCLTLEQLEERRKGLHMAMVKNLREELSIEAPSAFRGNEKQETAKVSF